MNFFTKYKNIKLRGSGASVLAAIVIIAVVGNALFVAYDALKFANLHNEIKNKSLLIEKNAEIVKSDFYENKIENSQKYNLVKKNKNFAVYEISKNKDRVLFLKSKIGMSIIYIPKNIQLIPKKILKKISSTISYRWGVLNDKKILSIDNIWSFNINQRILNSLNLDNKLNLIYTMKFDHENVSDLIRSSKTNNLNNETIINENLNLNNNSLLNVNPSSKFHNRNILQELKDFQELSSKTYFDYEEIKIDRIRSKMFSIYRYECYEKSELKYFIVPTNIDLSNESRHVKSIVSRENKLFITNKKYISNNMHLKNKVFGLYSPKRNETRKVIKYDFLLKIKNFFKRKSERISKSIKFTSESLILITFCK